MFQPQNINDINIDNFRTFFNFSENEHWTGLTQNIRLLTADPEKLKLALEELLDEQKPLDTRIDKVTGENICDSAGCLPRPIWCF